MAFNRTPLSMFEAPNSLYAGGVVTIYLANETTGASTGVKATLYAGLSGTATLSNPQILTSQGRFKQPVYIDAAVVFTVALKDGSAYTSGMVLPALSSTDISTARALLLQSIGIVDRLTALRRQAQVAATSAAASATAAAGSVNQVLATIGGFSARFLQRSKNLLDVPNKGTARTNLGLQQIPVGQCYLAKDGADLRLSRENGRWLFIDGVFREIPALGVTLAAAGIQGAVVGVSRARTTNVATLVTAAHGLVSGALALVYSNVVMQESSSTCAAWLGNQTVTVTNGTTFTYPNTGGDVATVADVTFSVVPIYFIYAFMAGNVMTLEASQIQPAADATHGHKIKAGDASRTLVGMAVSYAGGAWEDDSQKVGVLSWFNRKDKTAKGAYTLSRTTNATLANRIEINAEIRAFALAWGDDLVRMWAKANGHSDTLGGNWYSFILKETVTRADAAILISAPQANYGMGSQLEAAEQLAMGAHLTAIVSAVGAGIGTWYGDVPGQARCVNSITTKG